MDLVTQLAIIAEEESAEIYHFTLLMLGGLAVLLALTFAVAISPDTPRKRSFWALVAASLVFRLYAGVKPEVKAWPEGVTNDGSCFDTNDWQYVELKWKLRESYPHEVPLTFWRKPTDGGDWSAIGEEPAGSLVRRFYSGTEEIPDNPTNYIYKVTSGYVPPKLPSIALVSTSVSNVSIAVSCSTNYLGFAAVWEARRQIYLDTRLPVWGPWTEIGQGFFIDSTNVIETVTGNFVNGRRNTEIRLKMAISDEGSNGVRP